MKGIQIPAFVSAAIMVFSFVPCSLGEGINLIESPGFEKDTPRWLQCSTTGQQGAFEFTWDDEQKHTGQKSMRIINVAPCYSYLRQVVEVKPRTRYRASCWVRTFDIGNGKKGANLSVAGSDVTSPDIRGTSGKWEHVQLNINVPAAESTVVIQVGLGSVSEPNTGTAWFDDVTVEQMAQPDLFWMITLVYGLMVLCGAVIAIFLLKNQTEKAPVHRERTILWILLCSAFLFRVFVAPLVRGYPNDVDCFMVWSSALAENFSRFYHFTFDFYGQNYPPLFMYVLLLLGKIAAFLQWYTIPWAYSILLKLPCIIADLITAYLLYQAAGPAVRTQTRLVVIGFYLFNPAILIDSTIWGQNDAILALIIVAALYAVSRGKIRIASIFFAAMVLMKPQGIIFLPVLAFELIKRRDVRLFLECTACGVLFFIVMVMPFVISHKSAGVLKFLFSALNYDSLASVNAFNLFALLGGHGIPDSNRLFVFSYFTWGMAGIVLVTLFSAWVYVKGNGKVLPFICGLVLIVGVYLFSTRMHERYVFPAIALSCMCYLMTNDRRFSVIYFILSTTTFLNIQVAFFNMLKFNNCGIERGTVPLLMFVIAIVNLGAFVFLVKTVIDITVRKKTVPLFLKKE